MEIQYFAVGNPNTEHLATPWVELELNSLSTSEKPIEYGNSVENGRIHLPHSDKSMLYLGYGRLNTVHFDLAKISKDTLEYAKTATLTV